VFFDHDNKLPPAKRDGDWVSTRQLRFGCILADSFQFFVGGGSSSVGLFTIQLAKVAGYKVITTASPHSFDLVKSYGADHVVDYHNIDKAIEEVQSTTSGGVTGGLECIGGDENLRLAFKSFVSKGGKLSVLLPISEEAGKVRSDIEVSQLLLYMVGGYVSDGYEAS
jgi:NADPH:quinone reductase-like Zn-dependent oxidoreductase